MFDPKFDVQIDVTDYGFAIRAHYHKLVRQGLQIQAVGTIVGINLNQ